ncbi:ATP-binding protein [Streptomyces sp. ACA25]|uniref:ATP-binding protein n=1 Tax=Streptomyces sp. ACA25 TaxID=3022596 RepID=UPI002307783B|nr:ATP-binding protein [Streptomyces sp. ACA25]MDB1088071.1 ATP-binding protein [Streptomyces sp. ACA25]
MSHTTRADTDGTGHAWELRAEATTLGLWRKEVAMAVAKLGGNCEAVEVARLGVSELLSNVAAHVADPACRLEVLRDQGGIRVQLFDHSPVAPAVLTPRWEAERGRGLWLLRELADGLGYVLTPSGKWVWFVINSAEPDREAS